jgi:hypothetical protein
VLEEDYLSAVIKGIEPGLWINSDPTITLSVAKNSSRAVLANSGWLHDAFLVRNHTHRAMSDNGDSPI